VTTRREQNCAGRAPADGSVSKGGSGPDTLCLTVRNGVASKLLTRKERDRRAIRRPRWHHTTVSPDQGTRCQRVERADPQHRLWRIRRALLFHCAEDDVARVGRQLGRIELCGKTPAVGWSDSERRGRLRRGYTVRPNERQKRTDCPHAH